MPDLFTDLTYSWEAFATSTAGQRALRRWQFEELALEGFASLTTVVSAAQSRARGRAALDARDEIHLAMLRLASHDAEARHAALYLLRPGLRRLTRRYWDRFGDDTGSAAVEAALDRIVNYPHGLPRPAARILRHVDHVLWRAHLRQLRSVPMSDGALEDEMVEYEPEISAGEIVVALVEQAVRSGKVSRERANLVLQHRILSVPTTAIAEQIGYPASTIRQWRSRAEAAIALEAVA